VACGLCVEVCPYDAVELVEKRVLGHEKTVAQLDAALCMSCGVCAASCRSASIDLLDFSDESLLEVLQEELQTLEVPA
jgi:heterodisulfide reductase subunit A-like polyferredoxin